MPIPRPTPDGSRAMQYATLGETSARSSSLGNLHPRSVSSGQPGLQQHDSSDSIRSRSSRSSFSGGAQGIAGDVSSYENISHDEVPAPSGFEVPSGTPRPTDRRRTSWFGRGTPDKDRGKTE